MKGHNENTVRLSMLADEASRSLVQMQSGEEGVIGSWLAYGHALNEARSLFPSDEQFGQWIDENGLRQVVGHDGHPREVNEHERAAAMWAAANADQFEEARQRGNPRTIRGIHAKWKEIEAEREEEQRRLEAEAKSKADQETGATPHNQENKGDEAQADAEADDIGATQSKPDQETPPNPAEGDDTPGAVADGTSGGGKGSPAPAPEPPKEKEPKHILKLRREFRSLTPEAQEDDWVSLRQHCEELKSKVREWKGKFNKVKKEMDDLTDDDKTEVIRRLQAEVNNAGNAKWKAIEDRDAYHRQVNKLKKRVTELEQMGVAY